MILNRESHIGIRVQENTALLRNSEDCVTGAEWGWVEWEKNEMS